MNWHLYAGFLLVTLLLGLMPGPNVALIVVNSATYGVRHGLVTVLGAFGGLVLQVLAVLCGLAALLAGLGHWFTLLRWLGVAYLLWLGIRQWRAPSQDLSRVRPEPPGAAAHAAPSVSGVLRQPKDHAVSRRAFSAVHFGGLSRAAADLGARRDISARSGRDR